MSENKDFERPYLKGVIDRFENDQAVIRLSDGQELLWPRDKLASGIEESSSVRIIISNDESEQKEREKLAKSILNEILKGSK